MNYPIYNMIQSIYLTYLPLIYQHYNIFEFFNCVNSLNSWWVSMFPSQSEVQIGKLLDLIETCFWKNFKYLLQIIYFIKKYQLSNQPHIVNHTYLFPIIKTQSQKANKSLSSKVIMSSDWLIISSSKNGRNNRSSNNCSSAQQQ